MVRSFVISLLVLGLSCAAAAAAAADQAQTAEDEVVSTERPDKWAKPIELPGAGNFWKVSDDLYRGEQPTAEGFREIEKMGIKTDVNLRSFNSDRAELEGTNLDYVHIWSKAWHAEDEDVIAFLKVVADPETHPVFVHCQHGSDRTGMMVAVYRISCRGGPGTRR